MKNNAQQLQKTVLQHNSVNLFKYLSHSDWLQVTWDAKILLGEFENTKLVL